MIERITISNSEDIMNMLPEAQQDMFEYGYDAACVLGRAPLPAEDLLSEVEYVANVIARKSPDKSPEDPAFIFGALNGLIAMSRVSAKQARITDI